MERKTNCEKCPYNGHKKVYGEGSRIIREWDDYEITKEGRETKYHRIEVDNDGQYDIVIVGIAPARIEEVEERPFTGDSGKLLRTVLKQNGVNDFYICNILQCRITNEDEQYDAAQCCDGVFEEIKDRKPKLVIALGQFTVEVLTEGKYKGKKISDLEGWVLDSSVGNLIAIKHPRYYLEKPSQVFSLIEALRSSIRIVDNTYERAIEFPKYTVVDYNNLGEIKRTLDKRKELAVDIETTGLNAYGWEPNKILETGIAISPEEAFIIPEQYTEEFKEILENKTKELDFWNSPFDCAFLRQRGIKAYPYFDGMHAHYSYDERPYGHKLKSVCKVLLGCEPWDTEIEEYTSKAETDTEDEEHVKNFANIPLDKRYLYLARDCTRTYQVRKPLEQFMNKPVMERLLMPGTRMYIDIEEMGIRVNPIKIMDMTNILEGDLKRLKEELDKVLGYELNVRSAPQVQKLLYDDLKLPIDPYYGRTSDKRAMELYRNESEIVDNILDQKEIAHTLSTYLDSFVKFVDKNYRIHPRINMCSTLTGRLSASRPSTMNIKSDSDLKTIFLPNWDDGFGYLDVKGNELRSYLVCYDDKIMRKMMQDREADPHLTVTLPVYADYMELDKDTQKKLRTGIKQCVFGRMYKRGRYAMSKQVGEEKVDIVIETIDKIFPGIKEYYVWVMNQVKEKGYVESYFKRRRHFTLITSQSKASIERQAVNFIPQSTGSDILLLCQMYLWENRNMFGGVIPIWPIHDSLTSNMHEPKRIKEVSKFLEEYAEEITGHIVPFVMDTDWGYDWGMKNKTVRL